MLKRWIFFEMFIPLIIIKWRGKGSRLSLRERKREREKNAITHNQLKDRQLCCSFLRRLCEVDIWIEHNSKQKKAKNCRDMPKKNSKENWWLSSHCNEYISISDWYNIYSNSQLIITYSVQFSSFWKIFRALNLYAPACMCVSVCVCIERMATLISVWINGISNILDFRFSLRYFSFAVAWRAV